MIAGRYAVGRELGRGGMGAVWLGTDEVLGRPVALKRLTPTHGASRARAEREARLAARLSNPHVVAVYDFVRDGDDDWLVMEYVEGMTLSARVLAEGPLSPDDAAPLLAQVADALAAAHAAGVVHRDVKPSNILIDLGGAVKLTDFGIARSADGEATLTETGLLTGSPAYLAPEVALGRPAGPASDVWSLGATAFHALTGRPPYEVGDNVMGALYRIVHEAPPRADAAGWLAPLLAGTMTQDPEQRWSLAQVRAFLAQGAGGEPAPTRTLPAAAATAPPTPPPGPAPVTPPAPARTPAPAPAPTSTLRSRATPAAGPAARSSRRSPRVPAAIGGVLATVVLVVLLVAHPWSGGGGGRNGAGAGDPASRHPSTSPSPSGSPSGSPSPTASNGPTEAGIRSFVSTYLDTASSDPSRGFAMLTDHYRRASGGLRGYERFWGGVRKIRTVDDIVPSLDPLGVSYRYTYSYRGSGDHTERVQLRLVYSDGHYLIDAG